MKKILLTVMIFAFVANVSAQIKVDATGNVGIKLPNLTDIPLSALSIGEVGNSNYLTSLTGNGKNAILNVSNPTPIYLNSIGYGIRSSVNTTNSLQSTVAVGLWGETSNDSPSSLGYGTGVMGLSADHYRSYGVAGLVGGSNGGVGIYGSKTSALIATPSGSQYAGYFWGDIVVTGTIGSVNLTESDVAYKQNIEDIEEASTLRNILSLRPISYNLKQRYVDAWEDGKTRQIPVYDETSDLFRNRHYGLIAQELQEIYPDLVYTSGEGLLTVNYNELVPILIESVKTLNNRISELEGNLSVLRSSEQATSINNPSVAQCKLYQNIPNPFAQSTRIKVFIAGEIQNAVLTIYDLQGKQLKQIVIVQRGESTIEISGSEFPAGIYLYALIADGKEVDLKRMILTE
jgi:hypothetical protein